MRCISRCEKYLNEDFDRIMLLIKNGGIKCGKYSHLVKIDNKLKIEGKELFNDVGNHK